LDEVLSVGDESFRIKCQERLQRFWQAHCTIFVVSHDLNFIRESCEIVVWLDHGRIAAAGAPNETVDLYLASIAPA
jgi:lipopolysaccharide transport system ATP-binding protein